MGLRGWVEAGWVGGWRHTLQVSRTVLTLSLVSQRVEEQVNLRKEELEELFAEAPSLGAEAGDTDMSIEKRFLDLLEPLGRRKKQLELSKAKLQISRDLEDETVRGLQPPPTPGLRCQLPRGKLAAAQGNLGSR